MQLVGLKVINSRVRTPSGPFEWRGALPSPFPILEKIPSTFLIIPYGHIAKSTYRLLPNHKLIPSMQIASPCFSYLTKGAISYLEDKETS